MGTSIEKQARDIRGWKNVRRNQTVITKRDPRSRQSNKNVRNPAYSVAATVRRAVDWRIAIQEGKGGKEVRNFRNAESALDQSP